MNERSDGPDDRQGNTTGAHQRDQTAAQAREEYQRHRAQTRALREQRLRDAFPEGDPGRWLTVCSVGVTVLFAVVTVIAVVDPTDFVAAHFVLSVALFILSLVVFLVVLYLMAVRSRDDLLSIAGVFFLAGSAPRATQVAMLGSLAAQVVISVAGAAFRPFTPIAVGTLVPLVGLGLCGLWAVRYGHFDPQPVPQGGRR